MSSTILNDIVRDYQSVSGAWFTALLPIAQAVFWTLVLIELTWSAIWLVVDREDGLAVVTALLRKVLAVGGGHPLSNYPTSVVARAPHHPYPLLSEPGPPAFLPLPRQFNR